MNRTTGSPTRKTELKPRSVQVRCAIYTRKSSEEGLALEFNSLDAQRDSAEAFIKSQAHEGWLCLPDRYDDGGFTGGNMERPGLRRLLADIEGGKIDCVVVYKVDRLSRSLLDFARMMEVFDRGGVSFVSVTQHFNTTHSMGRLTLNILLSFAQFEREIIGERIRDKIAAQRQRGKWSGGRPILGYDVDRSGPSPKLVVNATEATRVRQIFALYLKLGSLLRVVHELRHREWVSKPWRTRRGNAHGGQPYNKCSLHALLSNPLYVGKVRHKQMLYAGEHEALIDEATWEAVQTLMTRNGRNGGVDVRNRHGALLKGLLRCKACGRAMVHTFTQKRGRYYRYYTCTRAIKEGYDRCPTPSLPAAEIDRVVIDQIRKISDDERVQIEVLKHVEQSNTKSQQTHITEQRQSEAELRRCEAEIGRLANCPAERRTTERLAELHEQVRVLEDRLRELKRAAEPGSRPISPNETAKLIANFDGVWSELSPREQTELIRLLVAQVEYDGETSSVSVSFHETDIRSLNSHGGNP